MLSGKGKVYALAQCTTDQAKKLHGNIMLTYSALCYANRMNFTFDFNGANSLEADDKHAFGAESIQYFDLSLKGKMNSLFNRMDGLIIKNFFNLKKDYSEIIKVLNNFSKSNKLPILDTLNSFNSKTKSRPEGSRRAFYVKSKNSKSVVAVKGTEILSSQLKNSMIIDQKKTFE